MTAPEARIVVTSIDTCIKYSEAVGQMARIAKPAVDSRTRADVRAENVALRGQLAAGASPVTPRETVGARRSRRS